MAKLRPTLDFMNSKFKSVRIPRRNVTIDESIVKFKGRLGFRQYMPANPIK